MMHDLIGTEIEVGSTVAYTTSKRSKNALNVGAVVDFIDQNGTPTMLVEVHTSGHEGVPMHHVYLAEPNRVVVLS